MKWKALDVLRFLKGGMKLILKRSQAEDVGSLRDLYDARENNRIGIVIVDPDQRALLGKVWVQVTDDGVKWGFDFERKDVDLVATTTFPTILNIAAGEARFLNPDTKELEMRKFDAWTALRTGKVRLEGEGSFLAYSRMMNFLDDFSGEVGKVLREVRATSPVQT